ncbi:TrmH family RNA methyltransferase [Actinobacteria bacterium YIM 96077]|uniref:TrmH family RNA methyltransferase n=1 Tax=Phytoactinopolyspora halophila TaxID=1981511 RepID=A0A329R4G2_9ACTN|nr:TrmH family RNA methyltransferase [Phytoactinopolyspora halophila]AYY11859.1 TrmH family RNA methyltransferase [Actinobacteria bacterium YIM 96077]RAW18909.1 TrmH family RNA methyltransferase [Phytoactinopolyspora halophila]
MAQLRGTDLKRLHRSWKRRSTLRLGLLLEGVQSPFNVGAIVRTAAAFGVADFYLVGRTASPGDAKAQKLAMGTDRYLRTQSFTDAAAAIERARDDGYHTVALELTDDARPLHDLELDGDVCVAVGAEDHGLSARCLRACDDVGYIPQVGRIGSLNVAAAAAVVCYEVRRQDWTSPGVS